MDEVKQIRMLVESMKKGMDARIGESRFRLNAGATYVLTAISALRSSSRLVLQLYAHTQNLSVCVSKSDDDAGNKKGVSNNEARLKLRK